MALVEVKVPDIGDFKDVEIIELLVKPGDTVKAEQSLITEESDKASMEIPSTHAGVVKELKVKIGDKVSEGSLLLMLEAEGQGTAAGDRAPAPATPPVRAEPVLRQAQDDRVSGPSIGRTRKSPVLDANPFSRQADADFLLDGLRRSGLTWDEVSAPRPQASSEAGRFARQGALWEASFAGRTVHPANAITAQFGDVDVVVAIDGNRRWLIEQRRCGRSTAR